jgi:hypothetical protein
VLPNVDRFSDIVDDRPRFSEVTMTHLQQAETAHFDRFDPLDDRDGWYVSDAIVSVFPLR